VTALEHCEAALAALQRSQCYTQYASNGTLARTKLGTCEVELQAAIDALQPPPEGVTLPLLLSAPATP